MGTVPTTGVSGTPINTRSVSEVETDRNKEVGVSRSSCPVVREMTGRVVHFVVSRGVSFVWYMYG